MKMSNYKELIDEAVAEARALDEAPVEQPAEHKIRVYVAKTPGARGTPRDVYPSEIISDTNPRGKYRRTGTDPFGAPIVVVDNIVDDVETPERASKASRSSPDTDVLRAIDGLKKQISDLQKSFDEIRGQNTELREQIMKLAYELFELKNQIAEDPTEYKQDAHVSVTCARSGRPSWMDKDPSELTPKEKNAKRVWECKQRKKNRL